MGTGNRLGLGAAVTFELGPDAGKGGERPIVVQRKPDDVLLFGLRIRSGAYSAKLLNGTRQRFSGFSQPRQWGEEVLRMLVTGGPPVLGGGGIPQRIITISRSVPALRTAGAVYDNEAGYF